MIKEISWALRMIRVEGFEESEKYIGEVRIVYGGSVLDKCSKTGRKKYVMHKGRI